MYIYTYTCDTCDVCHIYTHKHYISSVCVCIYIYTFFLTKIYPYTYTHYIYIYIQSAVASNSQYKWHLLFLHINTHTYQTHLLELPRRPVIGGGVRLLLFIRPVELRRVDSVGEIRSCTTIRQNEFWVWLLFLIGGWLKLAGTDLVFFLGISGLAQIFPFVSCRVIFSTRDLGIHSHEDVTRPEIPKKEKWSAGTIFLPPVN